MPLFLILGGVGLFASAGYFADKTGEAVEQTGNASLKIAAASVAVFGVYMYYKRKK